MHKPKPAWFYPLAIGVAALLLIIALNAVFFSSNKSDEQQIRAAIETMRKATLEGKPGGVQQYLSESFELPSSMQGGSVFTDKARVGDFISKASVNRCEVQIKKIEIRGSAAIATCAITADFKYLAFQEQTVNLPNVEVEFKREPSRRLLIIPDSKWRVIRFGGISPEDIMVQ